jgi:hypothetical protein
MAALCGCLIQANGLEALQVQCGDGFGNIVVYDAPQAFVCDINVVGHGVDRHLADEARGHLLKKQG